MIARLAWWLFFVSALPFPRACGDIAIRIDLGLRKQLPLPGTLAPTTYANDTLEIQEPDRFGPGMAFVCQLSGKGLRQTSYAGRPRFAGAYAALAHEGIAVEENLTLFFPQLPAGGYRLRFLRYPESRDAAALVISPTGGIEPSHPTTWPAPDDAGTNGPGEVRGGIEASPWIDFQTQGGPVSLDLAADPSEMAPPASRAAAIALCALELHCRSISATNDRPQRERTLRERFSNQIVFGGAYTSAAVVPGFEKQPVNERQLSPSQATEMAHRFGILASEFLDGLRFDGAQDRLYCGLMTYRTWDFDHQAGYSVYVPYLAIRRSRIAHGTSIGQGAVAAALNASNAKPGDLHRLAASASETPLFVSNTARSDEHRSVVWRYLRLKDGSLVLQPFGLGEREPRYLGIDLITYRVLLRPVPAGDYTGLRWRIRTESRPQEMRLQIVPVDPQDPPLFLGADGQTERVFLSTDDESATTRWSSVDLGNGH